MKNSYRSTLICLSLLVFSNAFAIESITKKNSSEAGSTYHIHKILSAPKTQQEFAGFLDNVLKQMPSKEFFSCIKTIVSEQKPEIDANLYVKIRKKLKKIIPTFKLLSQLKALSAQKKELSQQARQLLGNRTHIHSCLEIGQPATYINSMKNFLSISGPIYAMNESQKFSDFFQAGSIRPYTHFIPLHEYDPISFDTINDNSLDLIVCMIGLHHIPQEKLSAFIASLHRILKPGGVFILRDHDAHTDELISMVHTAHSIFNSVIPQFKLHEELSEYRNFQPLSYWIEILEQHGFNAEPLRLTQQGDPTLNTMVAFTKQAKIEDEHFVEFSKKIKQNPNYQRDSIQTNLTTPEWLNVDVSKEYGAFIEHTPFYEFPYIDSIKTYWSAFARSWNSAAKKRGHLPVLTSPYTLMNLFIGATMSVEYGAKSLISLPMRLLYAGEEPGTIQAIIDDPENIIKQVDPRIKVLSCYNDSSLQLIELPRYKEFLAIMQKCAATQTLVIKEIAGQQTIQFKVRYQQHQDSSLMALDGCTKEYSWTLPTQPNFIYAAVTVDVKQMLQVINQLQHHNIELLYIHDF